jgi:mannosyl-3-phosphoglycerate phosphatase
MTPPFVVLSDLDGSLLDRRTYAWDAARPALQRLRALQIPLVLCSSKTRAELEACRARLAPGQPFIVENGGAIYIPEGYFPFSHALSRTEGGYKVVEFGVRYPMLVNRLREIRRKTRLPLRGFSDMSVQEVAFFTGLPEADVEAAMAREYDEPLTASLTPDEEIALADEVRAVGLTLTRGGRFFHLMGGHNKGLAVEFLMRLYRCQWPGIESVGLGDGANDLSMLRAVDRPVVIPQAEGMVDPVFLHRNWRIAPAPGPAGWSAEILELLGEDAPRPAPARRSA